jgi:hypothetical protein
MATSDEERGAPAWLLGLGGVVLAVMASALVYAVVIAIENFGRIGV